MSLIEELKRRNVIRVGVLYLVAAWVLLQLTDVLSSLLSVPDHGAAYRSRDRPTPVVRKF
jgi:hypothetical protein